MLKFDRIVIVVLALGVWALVLTPHETDAHHDDADHFCDMSGKAFGYGEGGTVVVSKWGRVLIRCSH